jgi:3-keto-disaccharide hydrolase
MRQPRLWLLLALALSNLSCSPTQEKTGHTSGAGEVSADPLLGRWDLTVKGEGQEYPSWLELSKEGSVVKGRFVGKTGSARPVASILIKEKQLEFSLPKQYEKRTDDLVFKGNLVSDKLEGTTVGEEGKTLQWIGVRAPSLDRSSPPAWGEPIKLFDGKSLSGWHVRSSSESKGWRAVRRVLVNTPPSSDLISDQEFEDFKLHLEFNLPPKSNSGIYLRGRYEVQIENGQDSSDEPESHRMGEVYGFLTRTSDPSKKPGLWQSYDITLVGRKVTVALNGQVIIDNQEIPGITGGALNSNEGTPGPIFLQGDHGKVSFRNIVITPAKNG